MEAVRKYVDANTLSSIINLPVDFSDRKLEIIVIPVDEQGENEKKADISNVVNSLVGAIPDDTDMSLEDYRRERLSKYETVD